MSELDQLSTGVPGNKPPGVIEAAERRIEAWHSAHDREVRDLREQLSQCQGSALPTRPIVVNVAAGPSETGEPEKLVEHALEQAPAIPRRQVEAELKTAPSVNRQTLPQSIAREVPQIPAVAVQARTPSSFSLPDARKAKLDMQRQTAICRLFDGKFPDWPQACQTPGR